MTTTALASPTLFALPDPPEVSTVVQGWRKLVSFTIAGVPRPGGSKKSHALYGRDGKMIMKNDRPIIVTRDMGGEKTANWRSIVAHEARIAYQGEPVEGTLCVVALFTMPRPQSHRRKNGELKPTAPGLHANAPDLSKIFRSTEDALTGIIWRDDSRIARQVLSKQYGERPGAEITVYVLEGGTNA